jgi:hypothetical protein
MRTPRLLFIFSLTLIFLRSVIGSAQEAPRPHLLIVPATGDAIFSKLVESLASNNCIILAANRDAGVITFRTQSEDTSNRASRHVNILDGTILIRQETTAATRLQFTLTLSWNESYLPAGSYRAGVQKDADSSWYQNVIEMVSKAVIPSKN